MRVIVFLFLLIVSIATKAQSGSVAKYYERVYLQTSKGFYYKGETIWFKAYMNYAVRTMGDTLSKVLYVDLIDSSRHVIQSRILKIDSAHAVGNFDLPVNMAHGIHAIVAYTNWMRNFDKETFFVQAIPVLDPYEAIGPEQVAALNNTPNILLKIDSAAYQPRKMITVKIVMTDEASVPMAGELSVSVTDASQVPPTSWQVKDIRKGLKIPQVIGISSVKFSHRVEYGITFRGVFKSTVDKKGVTTITAIRGALEDVRKITTDSEGQFAIDDLVFNDSALFSFQAQNSNGKPRPGKVEPVVMDYPSFPFDLRDFGINVQTKETVQNLLSPYEQPAKGIMLEEVEVTSKRRDPEKLENFFGRPDITINEQEIGRMGSIEPLLRAKGLGFKLEFTGMHWQFNNIRARIPGEPFLTIDNVQYLTTSDETVGDKLMSLVPDAIDRIEISSLSASYIGANGVNGVVAVFLKKGGLYTKSDFKGFYIRGFDQPKVFRGPDYSNRLEDHSLPDNRVTLLWKNDLKIGPDGKGDFSFYTSDEQSPYRIIVEGVNAKGRFVHVEKIINEKK